AGGVHRADVAACFPHGLGDGVAHFVRHLGATWRVEESERPIERAEAGTNGVDIKSGHERLPEILMTLNAFNVTSGSGRGQPSPDAGFRSAFPALRGKACMVCSGLRTRNPVQDEAYSNNYALKMAVKVDKS